MPEPIQSLPPRASLEYLRKCAKERLDLLRSTDADAKLADAQLQLAREYGFASWRAMKAHVDRVTVARLCDAAAVGDVRTIRDLLASDKHLVHVDAAENDERRAIHHAVMNRQADAARVLMEAGSDARKGVYPNRDATTALSIATDRGYDEIVKMIETVEQHRREDASCPNASVSPEQDRINAAIRAGKTDDAIAMLSGDESLVRACDRDGASPLHVAAGALDEMLVDWLLQRRANIQKEDLKGQTPLDRAVYGVDPKRPDTRTRFAPVAARLRLAGAPMTLPAAVALGDTEAVARLRQESPDRFIPGPTFVATLTRAVKHRQLDMLRFLLDLGLDPNERQRIAEYEEEVYTAGSPLWHAALAGDIDAATLLLDRGADPNANLYASGTPTTTAFSTADTRMQHLLLSRGGRLLSTSLGLNRMTDHARRVLDGHDLHTIVADDHPGESLAEQLLWGGACGGDPEIVRMSLARIDWPRDDERWFNMLVQPLRIWNHGPGFWAGRFDRSTYPDCFRQILERADPNLINRQGATVLHRVASDGTTWGIQVMTPQERSTFATMLLDAGARTDVRDHFLRSTPLAWACRWGHLDLVELLLSRGVSHDEPDAEPWATPLAWARRYRRNEIVRILSR